MFAFSTAADAQFGKLLKKAKSAVTGKSSQDAYWEQQKKNEEYEKQLREKQAAEEKMMIDLKSTSDDRTVHGFWSVEGLNKEGYLDWQLKDESIIPRVKQLFDKKFGGITAPARGSSCRIDSKSDHMFLVGNIGTETTGWQYRRNDFGTILCRYVVLMVLMEFDDGENLIGRFEAKQDHIDGSTFDEDGMTVGFINGNINNTNQRVVNGWEVKTDIFTSTLKK